MGPYNVTKAGVVALSETLYGEGLASGVGVTVLCPTFFKTDIAKNARSTNPDAARVVQTFMDRAKMTANDVARFALEEADAGRLYAVPMADGRWMWRVKRLAPNSYYSRLGPVVQSAIRRQMAR
jgi:short-subunit dehydrogenase